MYFMRSLFNFLFCSLLFTSFSVVAQDQPSHEAEALYGEAMAKINSKHVRWIKATAAEVIAKKLAVNKVINSARSYGAVNGLRNQEIEALASLAMMLASKDSQEDLKVMERNLKSLNEQKSKLLDVMNKINSRTSVSSSQLDTARLVINQSRALKAGTKPVRLQKPKPTAGERVVTKQELDVARKEVKENLDSMNEQSELDMIKLQQISSQRSVMLQLVSNLMKKIRDNEQSIIKNLK